MNAIPIVYIFVAFSVTSTSHYVNGSPLKNNFRSLERRHNDKYPSKFWSNGSKKSSQITYISIPSITNWFSNDHQENVAQERSNPITNTIADDFLGKL